MNHFLYLLLFLGLFSCSFADNKLNSKKSTLKSSITKDVVEKQKKALDMVSDIMKYGSGKFIYKTYGNKKEVLINYNDISSSRYYKNAKVKHTMYAFIDFACPYSRKAFKEINEIVNISPNYLNIAYLIFPMDPSCNSRLSKKMKSNKTSCRAARLLFCVARDKGFNPALKKVYAKLSNLSSLEKKYEKCLSTNYPDKELKKEIALSKDIKFSGLPYVLLDKKPIGRLYNARKHLFMLLNYIDDVQNKH